MINHQHLSLADCHRLNRNNSSYWSVRQFSSVIQDTVQAGPLLLQEQFCVDEDLMHWQLISPKILAGARDFVIKTGLMHWQLISSKILAGVRDFVIKAGHMVLSSVFQPWPAGECTCQCIRAFLHTYAWRFALLMCCRRLSEDGGSSRLFWAFWQNRREITSLISSGWILFEMVYKLQMKAYAFFAVSLSTSRECPTQAKLSWWTLLLLILFLAFFLCILDRALEQVQVGSLCTRNWYLDASEEVKIKQRENWASFDIIITLRSTSFVTS